MPELEQALLDIEDFGWCIIEECGCRVEPDGACIHGNTSPLVREGLC